MILGDLGAEVIKVEEPPVDLMMACDGGMLPLADMVEVTVENMEARVAVGRNLAGLSVDEADLTAAMVERCAEPEDRRRVKKRWSGSRSAHPGTHTVVCPQSPQD